MTDHWTAIGRYLDTLESEIIPAQREKANRDEALHILREVRARYVYLNGIRDGSRPVLQATNDAWPWETIFKQLDTADAFQLLAMTIPAWTALKRPPKRRPQGSKVSEDRDIMAAFTAYSRFKAGSAASLTAAIRSTIADEKAAGRPLAGNSDESTQKRISRAVGEFRSVFDSMWNEAHAGH